MDAEQKWDETVKALLKAELKRRNVSYADLSSRLATIGVIESEPNIRNKIARGKFTAVFFFQCMGAIGVRSIRLRDD